METTHPSFPTLSSLQTENSRPKSAMSDMAWLRQLPPTSEVSCPLPVERCLLLKADSVMSLGPLEREFEQRRFDQCRLPAIQEQRSLSPEAWRGIRLAFVITAASIAAIIAGVRLLHYFRF